MKGTDTVQLTFTKAELISICMSLNLSMKIITDGIKQDPEMVRDHKLANDVAQEVHRISGIMAKCGEAIGANTDLLRDAYD